jgi:hypothetical protein
MREPGYTEGPKALENFGQLAMAVMQARPVKIRGGRRINLPLPKGNQNLLTRTRGELASLPVSLLLSEPQRQNLAREGHG